MQCRCGTNKSCEMHPKPIARQNRFYRTSKIVHDERIQAKKTQQIRETERNNKQLRFQGSTQSVNMRRMELVEKLERLIQLTTDPRTEETLNRARAMMRREAWGTREGEEMAEALMPTIRVYTGEYHEQLSTTRFAPTPGFWIRLPNGRLAVHDDIYADPESNERFAMTTYPDEWHDAKNRKRHLLSRRLKECERWFDHLWLDRYITENKIRALDAPRLTGKAQALFSVGLELNTNHKLRVPFMEELVANLTRSDPNVNWLKLASEVTFFFTHLMQGGLTMPNFVLCFTHLVANVPVKGLAEKLTRFLKPNAQAPTAPGEIIPLAIAGLVSIGAVWGFSQLPSDKSISDFITRFSRVGAMITSMEKLHSFSEALTKIAVSFFKKTVLGYDDADLDSMRGVDQFCDEVQALNTVDYEEKCKEQAFQQKVDSLNARASEIMKMLDALKVPVSATMRFRDSVLFLHRLRDCAANTGAGHLRARVPPLVVQFYGGTGVGKSSMLTYLNTQLLIELGCTDPQDLVDKVYYRFPGNEFYDGFRNGTEIVVCDDFGSLRDSAARPSTEPLEQIRMTNAAPYKPPMAHLIDKSKAIFEAKVVIWTSNRSTFKFDSLTNPEAVFNRVHMRFKHYPHPDYAIVKDLQGTPTVTLDQAKVEAAAVEDPEIYRNCWLFDLESTEGVTVVKLASELTFDQMTARVVSALKNKLKGGNATITDQRDYWKKALAARAARGDAQVDDDEEDEFADFNANVQNVATNPEPTFLGRVFGSGVTHLKTLETMRVRFLGMPNEDFNMTLGLLRANDEIRLNRLLSSPCVTVPKGREVRVAHDMAKCFFALANGLRCNEMVTLARDETLTICGLCDAEHNMSMRAAALFEATQVYQRCSMWMKIRMNSFLTPTTPFGTFCVCLFTGTAIATLMTYVVMPCFTWLFTKLFEKCGNEDADHMKRLEAHLLEGHTLVVPIAGNPVYTRAKISCYKWGAVPFISATLSSEAAGYPSDSGTGRPVVKTEHYHEPAVKARIMTNTEAYSDGAVKSAPVVKTEVLQEQEQSTSAVQPEHVSGSGQSFSDQNAAEIRRKVYVNMYMISTRQTEDQKWMNLGTFTMISGRVGLTNRHIWRSLKAQVRLTRRMGNAEYIFYLEDVVGATIPDADPKFGERDLAIVECPRNVPMHTSLTQFFMTPEDFSRHTSLDKVCVVGYSADGHGVPVYRETNLCEPDDVNIFDLNHNGVVSRVRNFYKYALETQPGDCGSLVVAFDKRFTRKICGVHMAGIDNCQPYTGAATAINTAVLNRLKEELAPRLKHKHSYVNAEVAVDTPIEVVAENGTLTCKEAFTGAVTYIGTARSKVFSSRETAMRASPVAELFGAPTRAPARLRKFRRECDGEMVDPLLLAMVKVTTPSYSMPASQLAIASYAVEQMVCMRARDSDMRVLTFEESIAGIPGDLRYPGINRSTSPGYGWVKSGEGKTKWLGKDEYVFDHPELLKAYDEAVAKLSRGERLGHYWTDTLKDELRPLDRVAAGKTRLFSAGEMVMTLLLRRYFDGFVAHLTRNNVVAESCVGINVFSLDWGRVVAKLTKHGSAVVAGDFSNYDGTLPADVLWEALRIINVFYSLSDTEDWEEENQIRSLLWLEIVNSVHISGNTVYSWTHSQPSGCPFTSILNSLVHSIIVRVAYLLCAERYCPAAATMLCFEETVSHVNYGDDDVTNIAPHVVEWFNQETMADAYATFGMTYTDEVKSGKLVPYKMLHEIQFLKRSFVFDSAEARWRAPLQLDTILDMCRWNKTRSFDQATLTSMTLQNAVMELAQHSEEVFNLHIRLFLAAARLISVRCPTTLPSFAELRKMDYDRVYGLIGDAQSGGSKHTEFKCGCSVLRTCGRHGEHDCGTWTCTICFFRPRADCWCQRQVTRKPQYMIGALRQSLTVGEQQNLRVWPQWLLPEVAPWSMGEVFTSIGDCVPISNNRLITQRIRGDGMSLPLARKQKLATNDKNKQRLLQVVSDVSTETMVCAQAFLRGWQPDETQLYNAVASLHRALNALKNLHAPGPLPSGIGGPSQSGDEPAPDFAGQNTEVIQQEVMEFTEDGVVHDATREPHQSIPRALLVSGEDGLTNDVVGFLSRPVRVANLVWDSNTATGTNLLTMHLPRDWIRYPMIAEKLAGFRYLRCTFVVEVQINAQPFNAGALLAYFKPLADQTTVQVSNHAHWAGKMGLPHVIYQCGQATAARIKVPFFSLISHYDLVKGNGSAGQVLLDVFSPLTGEGGNVDGTVWMWAENIDVSMPTGLPVKQTPIGGPAQSAAEKKRPGNIETIASTASRVADRVSALPFIGEAGKAGKLVFDAAGAVASMFGWSKPIDPEFTTEVQLFTSKNMANFNGDHKGRVMALDFKNAVNTPEDVFNTSEDEMAFKFLSSMPTYVHRFKFESQNLQGTKLMALPVDATICDKKDVAGHPNTVARYETNLSYLCGLATHWRGGLKYNFKIIKTSFHSGRLRFTWVPGAPEDIAVDTVDLDKCYSKIVDLREKSEVDFEIPYSYNVPWKPCEKGVTPYGARLNWTTVPQPMGTLFVTVVNSLRAPPTCAPSVDVLVFISGGDDFQIAVPSIRQRVHVLTRGSDVPPGFTGRAQSAMYSAEQVVETVNESTFGEAFTGFRQWLKRAHYGGSIQSFPRLAPYTFGYRFGGTIDDDLARGDGAFERAVCLYRFQAGSMRLMKARTGTPTENPAGATKILMVPPVSEESAFECITYCGNQEPVLEFTLPFYQAYPALLTGWGNPRTFVDGTEDGKYELMPYNAGTQLSLPGELQSAETRMSIGEDFSYGFFQGVPITVEVVEPAPPSSK